MLASVVAGSPGFAQVPLHRNEAPGDQLWVSRLDPQGEATEVWFSLGVSVDGTRVFIAGTDGGLASAAYDAGDGNQLWLAPLKGAYISSLGVSPDGAKVFVTGFDGRDFATVAYDAVTGDKIWVGKYDHGAADEATAIAVTPDGTRVLVTGFSFDSQSSYDYATVAYDANTGAQVWARRYSGPRANSDIPMALEVSPDGTRVFVTGYGPGRGTGFDYATVAYDTETGTRLWGRRLDGLHDSDDIAYSLGVTPDGARVFVTGSSSSYFTTVAYDAATGAGQWVRQFQGGYRASSLDVSPDGSRVFITGDGQVSDYATVAYETATGAQLWAAVYGGGGGDGRAHALAVSPDGTRVFVTGESIGSDGTSNYATLAYESIGGTQEWVSRYTGPGDGTDRAFSVGVSPDGARVFVTGDSDGAFATVAYSA